MSIDKKDAGLPPLQNPTLEGGGLDALGGMVGAIDAEAAAALNPQMSASAPGIQVDTGPDYHKGACGLVDLASAALDGYAPGAGWGDEKRAVMAASIAPVLEKYGWDIEGNTPCELVALFVCGPALYQSAKLVALKIAQDRAELARQMRGLSDPNTIRGAAAAESAPPAAPAGIGDITAADTLAGAAASLPVYPDM
ncbi:hypothetical protein [Paraburkholderia nemoris]|uniref:hypothetical protein n=1 Tax=Paraburkholderia nemoris TaxID=2793076 RepID=UPI001B243277|nr:hypothetical protein [Paraburkholderia nemoris]CAE6822062.1 hypothetical protein R75777_06198 [Paraburkholderia nemoris]